MSENASAFFLLCLCIVLLNYLPKDALFDFRECSLCHCWFGGDHLISASFFTLSICSKLLLHFTI